MNQHNLCVQRCMRYEYTLMLLKGHIQQVRSSKALCEKKCARKVKEGIKERVQYTTYGTKPNASDR